MRTWLLRWSLPLVLVLACTEHGAAPKQTSTRRPPLASEAAEATPPAVAAEPTEPSSPVDPSAADANPDPSTVTPAAAPSAPDEPHEPTDDERLRAYVADCSHRFSIVEDEYGELEEGPADECDYYTWEQNCAALPGGCWDQREVCVRECGKPCNTCQDQCATGCDRCKAGCDSSVECLRECAKARLSCRNTCMDALSECRAVDCAAQEARCNEAFERALPRKCPQCQKIADCLDTDHPGEEDNFAFCERTFPRARKVCFEWCWNYYEDFHDHSEP